MKRIKFYKDNIKKYIKNKNSKILVLGADTLDKDIFNELGYNNVVFSNYNKITNNKDYLNIMMQDTGLDNNSFDYCVAHACVHHSSKPHNSILEMYRISSKGALIIEANDCLLTRLACKLNVAEEYELSAIKSNKDHGGVDNTEIPNYVFRWTEREIEKLIKSFEPRYKHKINFNYSYDIKQFNNFFLKLIFSLFFKIFKKQQNLLSIFIKKPFNLI
ncbi:methyltransferase domain-containing protein [Candidatus Pelagibacter sp. HIMB1521]|uniref:methyltransferase domain-containing protein n=1 Tax=Candidatus Pelagibacter sp. HIMB1521 TaxID=3413344 RepID=UPI003F830E50